MMKSRSTFRNTCGCRIWRTKSFRDTGVWAGFGPHFEKPIGLNETKEVLIEKYRGGADREDVHLQSGRVRLYRPRSEQASRADALCAEERRGPPLGQSRRCNTARSASSSKARARTARHRPRSWAKIGASSRPRTMRCDFTLASLRTSSSSVRSIGTKCITSPATCSATTSS